MKPLLLLLFLCVSLSASAIGNPHNVFVAHRKAKAASQASRTSAPGCQADCNEPVERAVRRFLN